MKITATTTKRIQLNWGKMLGFNQVRTQENKQAKAVLAAKIGGKPGAGDGGGGGFGGIIISG